MGLSYKALKTLPPALKRAEWDKMKKRAIVSKIKKLLDLTGNQPLRQQEYNILNELLSKGKLTYFDLKRYKIKI
tara:strand:+ start:937 stop:1158 length:222 start_codon:yes stop_codon:yes gene_type:complete